MKGFDTRIRAGKFLLVPPMLVVVCWVLLFGCASYEVVETTEQIVGSSLFLHYLNSAVFLQPLEEFLQHYAKQQDQNLGLKSPGQRTFTRLMAFIEEPVKFAPGAEHPSAGVWLMTAYEGAGTATRKYNVWCFAAKNKAPEFADGVMGDTICNLELQFDVMPMVFTIVYLNTKIEPSANRTPTIIDTRVTDYANLDSARKRGSWTEEWIVVLGEETITVRVEFVQFADRTDFKVSLPAR